MAYGMTPLRMDTLRPHLAGAKRVAVLGIGSTLRGDDVAGRLAAAAFRQAWRAARRAPRVVVFLGETAPENLTGEIRRFRPSHLIMLDAADMGREPGCVERIPADRTVANSAMSTHSLPLRMLGEYLRDSGVGEVVIVGIQPLSCEFGKEPSDAVRAAAREVAAALMRSLE